MHGNVPVRFGRGRLDSLGNKGLAAYLMRKNHHGCGRDRPAFRPLVKMALLRQYVPVPRR